MGGMLHAGKNTKDACPGPLTVLVLSWEQLAPLPDCSERVGLSLISREHTHCQKGEKHGYYFPAVVMT